MQLAMSKTREKYPLSPRKVWKKTLNSMIGLTIAALLGSVLLSLSLVANRASEYVPLLLIGIAFIYILSALLTYLYQQWYYAVYFYDLHEDYIVIKKGPITPREITIPYERIQDVYVDQDLMDRMFGLYDVHLSSATASSGMAAHVDGLEKAAADGLRADLLHIVGTRISKKGHVTISQASTN